MKIIYTLLMSFMLASTAWATEMPVHPIYITYAPGLYSYSATQLNNMEAHYNTFVCSRACTNSDINLISSSKYRGIYSSLFSITTAEKDANPSWSTYLAVNPDTQENYYNSTFDEYMATFWDSAWLDVRIAQTVATNLDFVFLDEINMKKYPWLGSATLPTAVDTVSEWRTAQLNAIGYVRGVVSSNIDLAANSIHRNGSNTIYNGQDAVSANRAQVTAMEDFISGANSSDNMIGDMQVAHQVLSGGTKAIILSKLQYGNNSAERADYLAKYLMIARPDYSYYKVRVAGAWAINPYELMSEVEIDFGNPLTAVDVDFEDYVTLPSGVYTREYDSGYVAVVNLTDNIVSIPAEHISKSVMRFPVEHQVASDGDFIMSGSLEHRASVSRSTVSSRSVVARNSNGVLIYPYKGLVLQ